MTFRLPWWLSFALAGAAWFYLSGHAAMRPSSFYVRHIQDVKPALMAWAPWMGAYVGQYVVPAILGAAGIGSWWRGWRSKRLIRQVNRDPRIAVHGMDWRDFERLVGEIFRSRGYRVQMTDSGADGGVDVVVYRGAVKAFVQCKQWKSTKVGVAVVRELFGVMSSEGVEEGYVVTCGYFTEAAKDFAHGLNITLVDYDLLCDWVSV